MCIEVTHFGRCPQNVFTRHEPYGTDNTYAKFRGKIYFCEIYENDILKRNFIPCYCYKVVEDVDGNECAEDTLGLYDLVENKFYKNKGTGAFLKGEDIYLTNFGD